MNDVLPELFVPTTRMLQSPKSVTSLKRKLQFRYTYLKGVGSFLLLTLRGLFRVLTALLA